MNYGKVQVPPEALSPKNVKFRVTMFLDLDLVDEARRRAAKKGLPYQTFLNQILREAFFGDSDDSRIRNIVREELAKKGA